MKATGKLFVVLASALLALTMSVNGGTFVDTMDGPTLNPIWTLDQDPTWTYGPGGGFSIGGGDGLARFNNVGNYAYAHIETPVDTTGGIRVDAIMRQDNYPTSTFGMSVGIYYDANNWVSLKQGAAGGQNGWGRYMMVNGTFSALWGLDVVSLRQYWLISGIELTATQIKFYGSQIFPTMVDHYGGNPATAANYQEITELTIARPAGFTGNALVIIGKGWTRGDGAYGHTNPDFDNLFGSDNFAFSGIDYVRIITGSADNFEVWEFDPYINIVRTQAPPGPDRLSSINMKMARNEYRDSVFMVSANSDVSLQVTVEPLGGLPSNVILAEQTLYTKNRSPQETADAIYHITGPIDIPTGESRQFRLRYDSRFSGIAPGNYTFNVKLKDLQSGMEKIIPGTLEVWNIPLPSYDILPNNTWAELLNVELGQSTTLPAAMREMKRYGLNQVFLVPGESPNATSVSDNGTILTFDTALFDSRVTAIKNAWDSASGSEKLQWFISISGRITGPNSLGMSRGDILFPSALWQTVYRQYVSRLKARFAYHGIGVADWQLVFADESYAATLMNLEIPVAEYTKAAEPTVRTGCNSSAYLSDPGWAARYLAAFDVFQPNFETMVANPATLAWLKTSGKPVWTYRCESDLSEVGKNIYEYYRVYAWNLLKYGYDGTGLWTFSAQGGGVNSVWYYQTPCWWMAVKHYANDDVLHTRRYEMYREGVDDYRYVAALRTAAAARGRTAEAEQLIQNAITDITGNITNTSRCEYWRIQIAQKTLEMNSFLSLIGDVAPLDYNGDLSDLGVRIELRQGATVVRTEKMLLGAGGEFAISDVTAGTYDIAVKVGGWLQKVVAGVNISTNPTDIGTVSLINGDPDGDNEVTTSDLATILLNMDLVGD